MEIFLICTGITMGVSFLIYVVFLLIDHFSYVEGYENPKDFISICRKIFGYIFLISLLVSLIANFLGLIGVIPY